MGWKTACFLQKLLNTYNIRLFQLSIFEKTFKCLQNCIDKPYEMRYTLTNRKMMHNPLAGGRGTMPLSNEAFNPTAATVCDLADADLVALAQSGDERAFTILVSRWQPMLRAQVARLRLSYADAEDMAQETLLGLLAAVQTFRAEGGASFRTYAAVCVRNRLFSALRRVTSHDEEVMATPEESLEQVAGATDPAVLVVERESADRLLARLRRRLTTREYAVLLRYLDGFSYAEIAADMQMTSKAVDNALQRVRRKMREGGFAQATVG